MTLRSVNYSNYSVISTPQCHITHHIFYSAIDPKLIFSAINYFLPRYQAAEDS